MRKSIVAGLLAGAALPLVPVAHAQDSADTSIGADEIIVTARRREESLSKVPIAITAISGDDLAKRAIYNENDLQAAVPGLVIRQNGGVHAFNYSIRGQSVDTFTNSPPSVLPYINEVQIVTHNASTFYDMGGIQVLKGPQGTLFRPQCHRRRRALFDGQADRRVRRLRPGPLCQLRRAQRARRGEPAAGRGTSALCASREAGPAAAPSCATISPTTNMAIWTRNRFARRCGSTPTAGLTNTTVFQYTDEDGTNTPYQLWSVNPDPCPSSSAYCLLNPATNPGLTAYLAAHPSVFQGGLNAAVALQREVGPWGQPGELSTLSQGGRSFRHQHDRA